MSIEEVVRSKYAAVAASELSGDHSGVKEVAEAFGYSPDELGSIPAEANMGLSCGNPTAYANLKPGEVVVDLGCAVGWTCCWLPRSSAPRERPLVSI
jgi:arsenite methyltransferase